MLPINKYRIPQCELGMRRLADEFVEWSEKDDSIVYGDFPASKGISPSKFRNIKNDYFQDRFEVAMHNIASRREKLTFDNKKNTFVWGKNLAVYDKEYREYERQKDEEDFNKARDLIINLKSYGQKTDTSEDQ